LGVVNDGPEGTTDAEETGRRLNRELIELLNELRVALPGVQVLFAFLLIVPFSERFHELGREERALFFVAFLASAVGAACLIAPSAYHRLRWRHHDKERMLVICNRLAITGMGFLALAMTAVACLITSFLYGTGAAVAAAVGVAVLLAGLWFGLPLSRAHRRP
jgi:hypothetical protein